MELFSESELLEYVAYWGGDLATIDNKFRPRTRGLSAVMFYCLHHPEMTFTRDAWRRNRNEAVAFLWTWLKLPKCLDQNIFRTQECRDYFQKLLDGYINLYGPIEVFRFRYQNWRVVNCEQMVDQLWTVMEMSQGE